MTAIKWQTKPTSERSLQLRKSLDALSVPTRYKRNIASMVRVACDGCPFRSSDCTINTSRNNPYGHLAVILTRGSTPRFPDVASNRRNLRNNLDDPTINVDKVPCDDLLQSPKAVRGKYSQKHEDVEDELGINLPPNGSWQVMIDFPVVVNFDHEPSQKEIDAAIDDYYRSNE